MKVDLCSFHILESILEIIEKFFVFFISKSKIHETYFDKQKCIIESSTYDFSFLFFVNSEIGFSSFETHNVVKENEKTDNFLYSTKNDRNQ